MSSSFSKIWRGCGFQLESQVPKLPGGSLCVLCSFPITTTGHPPSGPSSARGHWKGEMGSAVLGHWKVLELFLKCFSDQAWVQGKMAGTKADPAWCCTIPQSPQADFIPGKPLTIEEMPWPQMATATLTQLMLCTWTWSYSLQPYLQDSNFFFFGGGGFLLIPICFIIDKEDCLPSG